MPLRSYSTLVLNAIIAWPLIGPSQKKILQQQGGTFIFIVIELDMYLSLFSHFCPCISLAEQASAVGSRNCGTSRPSGGTGWTQKRRRTRKRQPQCQQHTWQPSYGSLVFNNSIVIIYLTFNYWFKYDAKCYNSSCSEKILLLGNHMGGTYVG